MKIFSFELMRILSADRIEEDPIFKVLQAYNNIVSIQDAACELEMSVTEITEVINKSNNTRLEIASFLVDASITRTIFNRNFGNFINEKSQHQYSAPNIGDLMIDNNCMQQVGELEVNCIRNDNVPNNNNN
ncbi:MAG: hypothetical protein HRU09_10840 [Oligoflexales bacterium]|nr:hypothetical protein [Oligoflexales bacterium]